MHQQVQDTAMESSNTTEASQPLNEILHRRVKNRERQRRYRERKRLKANALKTRLSNPHQPSKLQIVSQPTNVSVEQDATRIHCKRDWKKDARRAYAAKQEAISNGQSTTSENQMLQVTSGALEAEGTLINNAPLSNAEKVRSKLGRRHWKVEARNKK